LAKVFRIFHTRKIEADQVEMSNAKVALANIANRVPNTYITNEGWVVEKMRLEYVNKIVAILTIFTKRIRCNILTISLL
jgi:hypothetical protein